MTLSLKIKHLIGASLFALPLLSTLPVAVQAAETLTGGLPPFPPFAYPKDPKKQGVVDLIYKKLGEKAGVNFDVKYYPYPRVVESMKNGDLDVAIIFKNKSLKDSVTYIGEVSKSKVIVIPKAGITLNKYEDLYNLNSLATLRKANFEKRFDDDTKIKKKTVVNYAKGLQMMAAGRMDAIVGSQSGLEDSIRILKINTNGWGKPLVLSHKQWWLHMSNKSKHQDLIPKLEKAVEELYNEDLVYSLYLESQK